MPKQQSLQHKTPPSSNNAWNAWVRKWQATPSAIRKPLVMVIGAVIVLGGIVLLPLPGPGWVIIFAGFALLATEFEFAEKVQDKLVVIFKQSTAYLKATWNKLWTKH